jgi:hypothetical protein
MDDIYNVLILMNFLNLSLMGFAALWTYPGSIIEKSRNNLRVAIKQKRA